MSRLFDALQRAGAEQSGVEFPDLASMVSGVFEPEPGELSKELSETSPCEMASRPVLTEESTETAVTRPEFGFPSLNVSIAPDSRLIFFTEPDSLPAEKFRFLSVRLRQIQRNRPLKRVLITSAIPEEGKSLVTANLAGVLARRKQRVLLIEGDLRRPVLARQFGLGRLAGLGEWLQGDHEVLCNIYRLADLDFWMTPAGDAPANPLELMQSGGLSRFMSLIGDLFDWIIVDSPPLLPLADAMVWSRLTEGTLLVARVGTTEKGQLRRALDLVKKADLIGVVLNGTDGSSYENYYHHLPDGTNPI
jgi:capsular exopolysaccharide synthesis family protein